MSMSMNKQDVRKRVVRQLSAVHSMCEHLHCYKAAVAIDNSTPDTLAYQSCLHDILGDFQYTHCTLKIAKVFAAT
jgi:hypothetical protein